MNSTALSGRHILVTGGGTGIGRACAKRLVADGKLHGVVANAGGGGMPMAYGSVDTEEFLRVLNLTCSAPCCA
jgi:NAD(P)-dependent dehydrogenase (short-subunit alcohol dehydrogenase family)